MLINNDLFVKTCLLEVPLSLEKVHTFGLFYYICIRIELPSMWGRLFYRPVSSASHSHSAFALHSPRGSQEDIQDMALP